LLHVHTTATSLILVLRLQPVHRLILQLLGPPYEKISYPSGYNCGIWVSSGEFMIFVTTILLLLHHGWPAHQMSMANLVTLFCALLQVNLTELK